MISSNTTWQPESISMNINDKRGAGASTGDWQHSSFQDLAGDTAAD
jgi:hypothetical protein